MNPKHLALIEQYREGILPNEEISELQAALKSDRELLREFVIQTTLTRQIFDLLPLISTDEDNVFPLRDDFILPLLPLADSNLEKCAESREFASPETHPVAPSAKPRARRPWSRVLMFGGLASLAAIVWFAASQWHANPPADVPANVVQSADAEWTYVALSNGEGLEIGKRVSIKSGSVEIRFKKGTTLKLIGPGELSVDANDTATLFQGRIVVANEKNSPAFCIKMPKCTAMQSGEAEYHVVLEADGTVQVDSHKGAIKLQLSGTEQGTETLAQFDSVRIDGGSGKILRLKINPILGEVTQKNEVIKFELADYLEREKQFVPRNFNQLFLERKFIPYQGAAIINGVFMPDSNSGSMKVDSLGRTFEGFPDLRGVKHFNALSMRPKVDLAEKLLKEGKIPEPGQPAKDGSRTRSSEVVWTRHKPPSSVLGLLNFGVTIDLHGVAAANPGKSPIRFSSVIGKAGVKFMPQGAEALVFIDGQLRFQRSSIKDQDGPMDVSIPLTGKDRFLTLVGIDPDAASPSDWIIIGDPVVELSIIRTTSSAKQP